MCTQPAITFACACQRPYGPVHWCSPAPWRPSCAGITLARSRAVPVLCTACARDELLGIRPRREPLGRRVRRLARSAQQKARECVSAVRSIFEADTDEQTLWTWDDYAGHPLPIRAPQILRSRTRRQRVWTGVQPYIFIS